MSDKKPISFGLSNSMELNNEKFKKNKDRLQLKKKKREWNFNLRAKNY